MSANTTRLLAIGERTNPWFQECSDHFGKQGDLLLFDTDLIGPYGYCADLSRSWTIGLTPPSDDQNRLYEHAFKAGDAQRQNHTAGIDRSRI